MRVDMESETEVPPLVSERLLMENLEDVRGQAALVISTGRAQLAGQLAQRGQFPSVQAWYYDLYPAMLANDALDDAVEVLCGADLPEARYDLVAMGLLRRSESELTRELIQQAYLRLVEGGMLAVSVDNPRDTWLHDLMRKLFPKVTCLRLPEGSVYLGRKRGELKKEKDYSCEYAFRDDAGRLLKVLSRPGVFSHRRLDGGARQLMLSVEIGPEDRVLDMGCGAGALTAACAVQTSGLVFGVDSNARAIECLKATAKLNQLENIRAVWNADGQLDLPCEIDVAVANPPYFGDTAIAQHFIDTCFENLRVGGALLVVTKQPNWVGAYMNHLMEDLAVFEASKYWVVCGRKPAV
ncbi:MAG: methyltransferase domain-containing protein [Planctomycetota bacterium]|nr:MAG: methyltransferase domain-containing protein [Planctomycetota bacterium]